jgi:serine/threonine-protein kinase
MHPLGRGAFGTVYRAEGVRPEVVGPAALKLAHAPNDERFAREVGLLSRLRHPCIPRFLGHGHWQSPAGLLHPFVAMELVEGPPLYEWAHAERPTSRQLLRLLAGLARALEAVHAAGGVHRDVKGGNVLVRAQDGRGFLVDFGSCSYQGASPLTWHPFPPGTLAYRPPEAFAHSLQLLKTGGPLLTYSARPADDVFALGVTAWRLVTGTYPPPPQPLDAQAHIWAPDGPGPQPAHELNARCGVELSALISRMLSARPEARGSAGELAEALERTACDAGPQADMPLFLPTAPQPRSASPERVNAPPLKRTPERSNARATTGPFRLRALHGSCQPWLSAVLAGAVVLGTVWLLRGASREEAEPTHLVHHEEGRDAGSVGLGDTALTAPVASPWVNSTWSPIALDMPSKPLPGQLRPDASGRCPHKSLVAINGGCWKKTDVDPKDCGDYFYEYNGACYQPMLRPLSPPTSSPTDAPDGGAR